MKNQVLKGQLYGAYKDFFSNNASVDL